MDVLMHFLGICGDSHAHIDLLDILIYGGLSTFYPFFLYIKFLFTKKYLNDDKEKINRKN